MFDFIAFRSQRPHNRISNYYSVLYNRFKTHLRSRSPYDTTIDQKKVSVCEPQYQIT